VSLSNPFELCSHHFTTGFVSQGLSIGVLLCASLELGHTNCAFSKIIRARQTQKLNQLRPCTKNLLTSNFSNVSAALFSQRGNLWKVEILKPPTLLAQISFVSRLFKDKFYKSFDGSNSYCTTVISGLYYKNILMIVSDDCK
jgi:hypothetical protein